MGGNEEIAGIKISDIRRVLSNEGMNPGEIDTLISWIDLKTRSAIGRESWNWNPDGEQSNPKISITYHDVANAIVEGSLNAFLNGKVGPTSFVGAVAVKVADSVSDRFVKDEGFNLSIKIAGRGGAAAFTIKGLAIALAATNPILFAILAGGVVALAFSDLIIERQKEKKAKNQLHHNFLLSKYLTNYTSTGRDLITKTVEDHLESVLKKTKSQRQRALDKAVEKFASQFMPVRPDEGSLLYRAYQMNAITNAIESMGLSGLSAKELYAYRKEQIRNVAAANITEWEITEDVSRSNTDDRSFENFEEWNESENIPDSLLQALDLLAIFDDRKIRKIFKGSLKLPDIKAGIDMTTGQWDDSVEYHIAAKEDFFAVATSNLSKNGADVYAEQIGAIHEAVLRGLASEEILDYAHNMTIADLTAQMKVQEDHLHIIMVTGDSRRLAFESEMSEAKKEMERAENSQNNAMQRRYDELAAEKRILEGRIEALRADIERLREAIRAHEELISEPDLPKDWTFPQALRGGIIPAQAPYGGLYRVGEQQAEAVIPLEWFRRSRMDTGTVNYITVSVEGRILGEEGVQDFTRTLQEQLSA